MYENSPCGELIYPDYYNAIPSKCWMPKGHPGTCEPGALCGTYVDSTGTERCALRVGHSGECEPFAWAGKLPFCGVAHLFHVGSDGSTKTTCCLRPMLHLAGKHCDFFGNRWSTPIVAASPEYLSPLDAVAQFAVPKQNETEALETTEKLLEENDQLKLRLVDEAHRAKDAEAAYEQLTAQMDELTAELHEKNKLIEQCTLTIQKLAERANENFSLFKAAKAKSDVLYAYAPSDLIPPKEGLSTQLSAAAIGKEIAAAITYETKCVDPSTESVTSSALSVDDILESLGAMAKLKLKEEGSAEPAKPLFSLPELKFPDWSAYSSGMLKFIEEYNPPFGFTYYNPSGGPILKINVDGYDSTGATKKDPEEKK